MIVDDEPYNIDSLKVVVQCAFFERPDVNVKSRLDTACNGEDAIKILKENYEKGLSYKLILMDCNMPKMDGYVATQLIRKYLGE